MDDKRGRNVPPHIQIAINIFEIAEVCRRENNALRSILRKQGLSDAAIRSKVRRLLQKPEADEFGAQLLKRVCEESLKRYEDLDLVDWLSKAEIRGKPQ
jgi:hypothetical protein